ncbi:hypothetical protein EOC94_32185 [Mesorhizobium sp. M6A.T.Ce.TU.016.01.1.1]|nr:hypothetical protein EOC94_32185 [Mesorhizobium sp. M6A.T.Ce.TU.016.01.1.1]
MNASLELSDFEWSVIQPHLPNKVRGLARVDGRKVLNSILWRFPIRSLRADVPDRYRPVRHATVWLGASRHSDKEDSAVDCRDKSEELPQPLCGLEPRLGGSRDLWNATTFQHWASTRASRPPRRNH